MAKILIGYSACELTRKAFEQHGHEVWTCDLLPARGDQSRHLQCDVWDVLHRDWDMAVLHPMCTYLTCSAAWAYKDPDFDKYPGVGYHQKIKPGTLIGADRRAAQKSALENFRRLLALPYPVAIENPAGPTYISTNICKPSQIIHPHQFGDDAAKATGLWLTKGLPLLVANPEDFVKPRMCLRPNGKTLPRWANQTDSGNNSLGPSDSRWLERSETYPGIAAAMGDQWGRFIAEVMKAQEKAA